ncbi:sigma-70 family RNA polymerase sigma factor [Stomatohabitans albus]|uniref:sigma-70 family RNA polymerase sigma factor n=1 Tax=Stomatohabitans albus TaxID=3110766 RepID=UPI00300C7776
MTMHKNNTTTVEELITANLPLVQYGVSEIAARLPRHVHRDDLVSAAMLGLTQAAKSWNSDKGVEFPKFAIIRIRGALLDELRSRDWASRSVRRQAREMQAATEAFTSREGRTPSMSETAKEMGTSVKQVENLVHDVHRGTVLNYDAMVGEGDAANLLPSAEATPEEAILSNERRAYLADAVMALPERLRHVIIGYFFEGRQMIDIAEELGVTESRISQMRSEAFALIRMGMERAMDDSEDGPEPLPQDRQFKKKSAYVAAVTEGSTARERMGADRGRVHARAKAAFAAA